jgi:hypothetical protein
MNEHDLRRLQDWTRKVTRGQRESAVFLNLWSDSMATEPSSDPVPVMQLGYAMLLDKPIVILAPHGSRIPENVRRCARVIAFYDHDNMDSMHAATIRALKAAGLEVPQ